MKIALLGLALTLSLAACRTAEPDYNAPEVKERFGDGMTDDQLLAVAKRSVKAENFEKASEALRALSEAGTKQPLAYELRVTVYKHQADECMRAENLMCQIGNIGYAMRDQAVIAATTCSSADSTCKDRISESARRVLKNDVPDSLLSCWAAEKEGCAHPANEVDLLKPMVVMNSLKQQAVDSLLSKGGIIDLPLPGAAVCVAMNSATTSNPISIHNVVKSGDEWRLSYTRDDGASYSVGCKVSGSTISFRSGTRWNTESSITYKVELAATSASVIITQKWRSDGSENMDRIDADALSKFGVTYKTLVEGLRSSALSS